MYDFDRDEFVGDDRIPYEVIKWKFLNNYFFFGRLVVDSGIEYKSFRDGHVTRIAFAYEECENFCVRPIEKLMLEVLTLVLDAYRSSDVFQRSHRDKIFQILRSGDCSVMLAELPHDERKPFEYDMQLLNL